MLSIRTVGMVLSMVVALSVAGCDEDSSGDEESSAAQQGGTSEGIDTEGEPVDPPFAVEGDCEGLLLVWFDEQGVHTAQSRADIPESRRERVRVDSLELPPEERLPPEWVYVADLREEGEDGEYPVRKIRRAAFDALVDAALPEGGEPGEARAAAAHAAQGGTAGAGDADVVIYGASWCGACDQAASYLRDRGVPFVEKDIEKNPNALAEMQRKAKQAGVRPSGIPVIDFRGTILKGFDPGRLDQLIADGAQPI